MSFEKEKASYEAVKKLSKKIAEIAAPIATWGDGNCGDIIKILEEELQIAGLMEVSNMPLKQNQWGNQ